MEEQEGSVNFKFGVLYAKAGQGSDDEMFSNGNSPFKIFPFSKNSRLKNCYELFKKERGSKEFERFLTILGNKIRLKGWDKYRGGLDVKGKNQILTVCCYYLPTSRTAAQVSPVNDR